MQTVILNLQQVGVILRRKQQTVTFSILIAGSEIIEDLKEVPPSYPVALIVYNVPYDCDEEEMHKFLGGFNVNRVRELRQGMYKLEFQKCELALAFIKAEVNLMKGRDLIFRISRTN